MDAGRFGVGYSILGPGTAVAINDGGLILRTILTAWREQTAPGSICRLAPWWISTGASLRHNRRRRQIDPGRRAEFHDRCLATSVTEQLGPRSRQFSGSPAHGLTS
jgi:hypothetical protein